MTDLFLTGLIYYWGLTFHFAAPAALKAAAAGTKPAGYAKNAAGSAILGQFRAKYARVHALVRIL